MFSKKLGIFFQPLSFSVTLENLTITSHPLGFVWFSSLRPFNKSIQQIFSHIGMGLSGLYDINVNKCKKYLAIE